MIRHLLVMAVAHDNQASECHDCYPKTWPTQPGWSDGRREDHERDDPDDPRPVAEDLFHGNIVLYSGAPESATANASSPACALRSRRYFGEDIRNAIGAITKLMTTRPHIASRYVPFTSNMTPR
jgi:hypothetical protein